MPRRRIQHKGKPKHATVGSNDFLFRQKEKSAEEKYTTVVDFEAKKKYEKRPIESNWSKYEGGPLDSQSATEEELPKTSDLNFLLENASSDCAHFEFSSEKLWKTENNSVPASKIFDLDLNVLSKGLACVPFHERLNLDESELSAEDKQKFEEEAESSWKEYNAIREKSVKISEGDSKGKNLENNVRALEESIKEKLGLIVNNEENEKSDDTLRVSAVVQEEEIPQEIDFFGSKTNDKVEKNKQNIFFSEKDENLEDWLDSVLDD